MPISNITQNVSPVTALPGLLAEDRPAAVNILVEEELPLLSTELETLVGQLNGFKDDANALGVEVEANKNLAESSAILANGLANFQGVWSESTTYAKGQSVESAIGSNIYYTSKASGNLNNIVTNTNFWLYNPINDKIGKDINALTAKATPVDADNIVISDSESSHILKKLTWANIKATIISSFGVMLATLTAKATPVDADTFIIADSASSNTSKKLTWANIKATIISSFGVMLATLTAKATPVDADTFIIADSASRNTSKKLTLGNLKTYLNTVYLNFVANDSRVATALNAIGNAPIYACRAWVNFNSVNGTITGSGNVSSVTDNGLGRDTVNFMTPMPDTNYSVAFAMSGVNGGAVPIIYSTTMAGSPEIMSTTQVKVASTNGTTSFDHTVVTVAIFR